MSVGHVIILRSRLHLYVARNAVDMSTIVIDTKTIFAPRGHHDAADSTSAPPSSPVRSMDDVFKQLAVVDHPTPDYVVDETDPYIHSVLSIVESEVTYGLFNLDDAIRNKLYAKFTVGKYKAFGYQDRISGAVWDRVFPTTPSDTAAQQRVRARLLKHRNDISNISFLTAVFRVIALVVDPDRLACARAICACSDASMQNVLAMVIRMYEMSQSINAKHGFGKCLYPTFMKYMFSFKNMPISIREAPTVGQRDACIDDFVKDYYDGTTTANEDGQDSSSVGLFFQQSLSRLMNIQRFSKSQGKVDMTADIALKFNTPPSSRLSVYMSRAVRAEVNHALMNVVIATLYEFNLRIDIRGDETRINATTRGLENLYMRMKVADRTDVYSEYLRGLVNNEMRVYIAERAKLPVDDEGVTLICFIVATIRYPDIGAALRAIMYTIDRTGAAPNSGYAKCINFIHQMYMGEIYMRRHLPTTDDSDSIDRQLSANWLDRVFEPFTVVIPAAPALVGDGSSEKNFALACMYTYSFVDRYITCVPDTTTRNYSMLRARVQAMHRLKASFVATGTIDVVAGHYLDAGVRKHIKQCVIDDVDQLGCISRAKLAAINSHRLSRIIFVKDGMLKQALLDKENEWNARFPHYLKSYMASRTRNFIVRCMSRLDPHDTTPVTSSELASVPISTPEAVIIAINGIIVYARAAYKLIDNYINTIAFKSVRNTYEVARVMIGVYHKHMSVRVCKLLYATRNATFATAPDGVLADGLSDLMRSRSR